MRGANSPHLFTAPGVGWWPAPHNSASYASLLPIPRAHYSMLSLRAIASRLEQGELRTVIEEVMNIREKLGSERVYPLAWLLYRAWSAIMNVFGAGKPPSTEELSALEVTLTSLAVEAMLYAERGIVDERLARELAQLLIDDKLVSMLRSCRAGSCNPRLIANRGLVFKLLGEVLSLASGKGRDCIPG